MDTVSEPQKKAAGTHPPHRSLLSRELIYDHRDRGNVVIEPFRPAQVNTTSYDVRLGLNYYKENDRGLGIFNPWDKADVEAHWSGPHEAVNAGEWMDLNHTMLNNVRREDRLILLGPGETILAHTDEFIGGRHCIGQEMRARSTMGRIGITVCKCAGWGDCGYVNRWTMEITNILSRRTIPLIVGMRIAQLVFWEIDPLDASYAAEAGKYQTTDDMEELKAQWGPEQMVPRLYKDKDLVDGFPKPYEITKL